MLLTERRRKRKQAVAAEQAALASAGLGGIASPGSSFSRDERKGNVVYNLARDERKGKVFSKKTHKYISVGTYFVYKSLA